MLTLCHQPGLGPGSALQSAACAAAESPVLGLILQCHCLEILNEFELGEPYNYVATVASSHREKKGHVLGQLWSSFPPLLFPATDFPALLLLTWGQKEKMRGS